MQALAQTADPQAVAAVKLVSWVTAGAISPSENDFNMWTDAEEAAPGKAPSTGCAQHWSEVEALLASSEIRIFIGSREGRETTCNIAGTTLFARWKPLCLSAVSSSTR